MEEQGPATGGAAFAARGLTVRFGGISALDAVSVEVAGGEVLGIIGPNGAGKTTLFNVICGFVEPQSGTLEWKGRVLTKVRTNRLAGLGIARTLQGVGLFPGLSVLENVMAGAQRFRRAGVLSALLGLPRSDRDERALRERALAMLGELGCEDVANRSPRTLPYPVQKRVALARALVGEPELLLLDEPAGGLGADEVRELGERIRALRGSMAVMLVEHRMDLVMSACDRVVVLDFGQVIAQGDPVTVRDDQRVVEAYLGREAGQDTNTDPPLHREGSYGMALLEIEALTTDYGPVRAVDHVTLAVEHGSITAVLGANGAGKTSLLRTISGLERATEGEVRLDGEDLLGVRVEDIVRLGLAHVPEGRGVIAELSTEENLRLGGLWRGGDATPLSDIYELFPLLRERREELAASLSGGERQMLSIGRALMARPRVLLLDEPSLGLAPIVTAQIMRLISSLAAERDLAVLLVEQNARSALSIADRGVVLNLGRVVADDTAHALASDEGLRNAYLGF